MNTKQLLILGASVLASVLGGRAVAQEVQDHYIRLPELEIDPAQLEAFNAAIKEEIETAVRVEPGVLMIHALSEKDNPNRIRMFEMYADENAYKTHLETPHFKKFRATTANMVKSRRLVDAVPIILGAKAK